MTIDSTSIIKKLLIVFLVFTGLHYAKEFIMPMLLGAVLATLFLPFSKWMEAKRAPRFISSLICLLSLVLGIIGVGALLGWQISELTNDITLIKQKLIEIFDAVEEFVFNHVGVSREKQIEILSNQQSNATALVSVMAGSMFSVLADVLLILVYVFLFLYYRTHIQHFILKLAPPQKQNEVAHILHSAALVSQQYLVGLAKMIACLWVMYSIGFSIVGIENAFFFAFLCGLFEIVPFIGNITGTALTVLVATVHGASLPMIGGVVITYGIVQFIQGWVLEPLILGPQVKINPLFTIIALVLGELVWGIPGIILAIPITAILKIVCDHIEPLKPYGFLMGELYTPDAGISFIKKMKNWFKKRFPKLK
jgi:predicted PurR-regulated permease PerM